MTESVRAWIMEAGDLPCLDSADSEVRIPRAMLLQFDTVEDFKAAYLGNAPVTLTMISDRPKKVKP